MIIIIARTRTSSHQTIRTTQASESRFHVRRRRILHTIGKLAFRAHARSSLDTLLPVSAVRLVILIVIDVNLSPIYCIRIYTIYHIHYILRCNLGLIFIGLGGFMKEIISFGGLLLFYYFYSRD